MPSRPARHDPANCLDDIIANAERIARYLTNMDRAAFAADERTRDAVERCLARICEAAFRLGDLAEDLMPGLPWSDIRGMGNRLRHGYDALDQDIIWNTARNRVPELAVAARAALAGLEREQASIGGEGRP